MHSEMEILESCVKVVEKTSTNIWSRRGKATIAPQVRTSKSILKNAANVEVAMSSDKDIRNRTDKENISPNTN